jgi:hypothetical protein
MDWQAFFSPSLCFFIITTFSYPFARFICPHIKSRTVQALLHLTFGLIESVLLFGWDTFYCIFMVLSTYACLHVFRPPLVMFICGVQLFLSHYIIFLRPAEWSFDMCSMTMVFFQKIVALCFNLEDGQRIKRGEKLTRERWRVVAVEETPSLLNVFAYAFTPFGSFSTPFIEYKLFEVMLTRGERGPTPEEDRKAGEFRFFGAFAWAAFVQVTLLYISYENTYLADWYLNLPLYLRVLAELGITFCLACRYFAAWWLVESGYFELGLGSAGIIPADEISNLSMWAVCSSLDLDLWFRRWNYTTHLFWKNYLFTRLLQAGFRGMWMNFFVFICSMTWHGFKPVYLAMLPEVFICIAIDKMWNKKFPIDENSPAWEWWLHWILVKVAGFYVTCTFFFPWMDQFWHVRKSVAFIPLIIWFGVAAVVCVLPAKKKKGGVQAQKTE